MKSALMKDLPAAVRLASPKKRWNEGHDLLASVEKLGAIATVRRYDSGALIFFGEEPTDGVYVITSGVVKVAEPHSAGREVTLGLFGEGDFFGRLIVEGNELSSARSNAYAEAVTECEIRKIPRVFVDRALRANPEAARILATMLESKLIQREELSRCVLPRRTTERIARLLPLLARKFGEETPEGAREIPLRLTHQDLANIVAATRESVTAALLSLRRRGAIKVVGGRIILVNLEELESIRSL